MTKTIVAAFLLTGFITIEAAPAWAQTAPLNDFFIDLNVGQQPSSRSFASSATPLIYGEAALITSSQAYDGAPFLDLTFGYRINGQFSAALGLTTTFSTTSTSSVSASIPNPILFDRLVTTTLTVSDLERKERTAHLMAIWTSPVTDKIDASLRFGPSYVKVFQDLVRGVIVPAGTQTPTADVATHTGTALGFNVGGDVTFLVTPSVGVGAMLRYVKLTVDLESVPDLKAGGVQVGGGLRFRF